MLFFLLLLCGLFAGAIAGLFGVGGGILFTPILYYLFVTSELADPSIWAIATSLFCTFIASSGSTIQQGLQKNSFLREGVVVGVTGTAGVYFGKKFVLSDLFTEELFVILFSLILFMVAILFYRRSRVKKSEPVTEFEGEMSVKKSVGAGVSGGLVASIAGVGGGIVLVPIMNLIYRMKLSKAISISSLAIVLISFSGWFQYAFLSDQQSGLTAYTVGYVDFGTAFPLILGAFAGGFVGVKAGLHISGRVTQILFSILILIIAFSMIRTLFV